MRFGWLVVLVAVGVGVGVSGLVSLDESSLRRRSLLRRVASASASAAERESRSRGGGAPPPPSCPTCPTSSCGTSTVLQDRRPKILDGVETVYGAYPWQVSIEKRGQDTGEVWAHICGGSLISKFHVLTAAHCFRDTLSDYRVIVSGSTLVIPPSPPSGQ
jgi:hypothetical protein